MQVSNRQKALSYFQQGDFKKAQTLYEKLLKKNKSDPEVCYMLGSIHGSTGNFKVATNYFQRAIKAQPGAFVAHCGLGAAFKELGEFSQAEISFRKALELKPDNKDIQLELAGILMNQQKMIEAEDVLNRVLEQAPNTSTALHGLGEIHHSRRNLDLACQYYRKALEVNPSLANTYNRLGFIYHTLGRLKEAIEQYKRAIEIQPDFSVAYKNMGGSLLTAGQLDQAREAFEKALAIDPDYTDATVSIASVLERQNRPEEAYEIIKPLLDANIRHPGLAITLAAICHKINQCGPAADYLNVLLSDTQIPEATMEQMYYALGNLYDKSKDYDKAFKCYRSANDLKPDTFSVQQHYATIKAIKNTFTSDFLTSAPRSSIDSSLPFFIVGMPRSGTSLTEQILSRHHQISGAGELLDIGDHSAQICDALHMHGTFPHCFKNINQALLDEKSEMYLQNLREISEGSDFVTDKMPQNFIHLGLISLLFPRCRIVHCIRDPRDVCLSVYFQHFNESHDYSTKLEYIAHYYLAYRELMEHWKEVLDIPVVDIHYEDLVSKQEETSRKLLHDLDLEWDPNCLDFHKSDRFVATSSYDQVRQPIYTRSMARWKNYETHIEPLISLLEPVL